MSTISMISRLSMESFQSNMDEEILTYGKKCLLDWLGLTIKGVSEDLVQPLIRIAPRQEQGSSILGRPHIKVTAPMAAFINGAASHSLDFDDTNVPNLIHISSALFPALIAITEQRHVNGNDFLKAFLIGYEIEDRLGYYVGVDLLKKGWHPTAVLGRIGAAASSAILLNSTNEQMEHAMAIASISSSGMVASFGTKAKPFQVGKSSHDGLFAALVANEGLTGPLDVFDKEKGFTYALLGRTMQDWDTITENWGSPYAVVRNAFKPYAACMMTHATIDASIEVGKMIIDQNQSVEQIKQITCYVNELAPDVAGITKPTTGFEGKFSLQYCCSLGLHERKATINYFTDEWVNQQMMQQLIDKISIIRKEDLTEHQAELEVSMNDGTVFAKKISVAKGNPSNPLSMNELEEKFMSLTEHLMNEAAMQILMDQVQNIEKLDDVSELIHTIKAAIKS